ncbi:MAG TPA: MFS transporter [Chthoniobacteraceae bacterium]|jgi:MFS family permease|nr:MFS transporter [Chthoniobacteraceae bacterium]
MPADHPPHIDPLPGAGRALALLLTINLFNYIDRQVLAAVEPVLSAEFKLTEPQAGSLASAFLYAYMIGAPILGRLAERWSRWWLIGISVAAWSLASGGTGLALTFMALVITRVCVGIGEAGYGPAAPALLSDYYPIEKRGRVLALFYLAIPVGSALGYVFGGKISALLGWRWAFWLVVPPGLALAVWCWCMKEPPRMAPASSEKKVRRSFVADALALLRIPSYVFNTAAMTAMTFAIGGISFWIPKFMTIRVAVGRGLDPEHLSDAMRREILDDVNTTFGIIVVVAGIVSTLLGSFVAEKLRPRFKGAYFLVSGSAILFAFPATLAMLKLPFPWAWIAVFCAVFFLFFNTGPANTALANVSSARVRATAFALNIFTIHALGDAISPPLIGWIRQETHSWNVAFGLVSFMMVVASVCWLLGARYLGRDTEAVEAIEENVRERV